MNKRSQVDLLFGVHNHQPVGNFEHILSKATADCYGPFVDTLYNSPQIKATFHFSGALLDWLLKNNPILLERVKEMLGRGQVEILSGGYFEPILPIIPEEDRLGQIARLNSFIKDYFHYQPAGAWIGERVWAPELIKTLIRCKIRYILLDDFHFHYAGIKKDLFGYFLAEEKGESLAVFPINKQLRYTIPFAQHAKVLAYLRGLAKKETPPAAIIVDDGEKFGLWPGTHKWVYHEKWLQKFFQLLIKSQDWLKTKTFSEYMNEYAPLGTCQLPACAYEEMITWSGGAFSNFLHKYPEVKSLHRRMFQVSRKISRQKSDNEQAKTYLYMSQSNCPYWHGVFGGVYLTHLRHFAYRNIIRAQSLINKQRDHLQAEVEPFSPDQDKSDELIIKNPFFHVFVAPQMGGAIFELDYLPKYVNIMDVMSRIKEEYHEKVKTKLKPPFRVRPKELKSIHDLLPSKDRGLENLLIYDSYRRLSLLDHFFSPTLKIREFRQADYEELGDFINTRYSLSQQSVKQGIVIILQREGKIKYQGKKLPLRISKELFLHNNEAELEIRYALENLGSFPLPLTFGIEFNFSTENELPPNSLCCGIGDTAKDYSLKEEVQASKIEQLALKDVRRGIEISLALQKKPNLWTFPLETVSASEKGFERNYQQTMLLPHWPLKLEKAWQTKITLVVTALP